MTHILSSDILPVDVHTSLEGNETLQSLVKKNGYRVGKNPASREQYDALIAATWGHEVSYEPAGPAATILTTLNQLAGAQSQFISLAGSNQKRSAALAHAGIELVPPDLGKGRAFQTPVTFIIRDERRKYIKVTYPGNIAEFLKPEIVSGEMADKADIVLVMGSLWQRTDKAFPDRLVQLAQEKHKQLWLTLPTHPSYTEANADFLKEQIAKANLLLANDEELARVFRAAPEEALRQLQALFKQHPDKRQTAFITRGIRGAAVITANSFIEVPARPLDPRDIVNEAGAGDMAFAGFAAGYLKDLPGDVCANIGMALANEKLKIDAPRLKRHARAVLHDAAPDLEAKLFAAPIVFPGGDKPKPVIPTIAI